MIFFLNQLETLKKIFYVYTLSCYIYCFVKDPGYVQKTIKKPIAIKDQKFMLDCNICETWKPPRAYHCKKCNKCVFKMDHHCYFINNCVGYRNMKSYILFLIGLMVFHLFYFFNSTYSSIYIFKYRLYKGLKFEFIFKELLNIFCLIQGCYFFPYTFNLFKKSLKAIYYNTTEVESVKLLRGARINRSSALQKVFGNYSYFYFFPYAHQGFSNYLEQTYEETIVKKAEFPQNCAEVERYFI